MPYFVDGHIGDLLVLLEAFAEEVVLPEDVEAGLEQVDQVGLEVTQFLAEGGSEVLEDEGDTECDVELVLGDDSFLASLAVELLL